MSLRHLQILSATLAVCLCVPSLALAQVGAGAIRGAVRDASGKAIPGVTLQVVNDATSQSRETVTDPDGVFAVLSILPGQYHLNATLDGFQRLERRGIRVATGETLRLDLELAVGGIRETVTVTADAPLLRTETGSLGQVVSQEKVVGLPLNGRNFITFASLVPGVALPPGSVLPRINGGRPRTNEYLFDGISVLQPEPGLVAFYPVIDAIQEFKIESNSPGAEFGRFNGGVVNLTTKSGGNRFSGTVFEFMRNEALNARNVFAPTGPKPKFRRNQFGGVVGGPIRRDRTFFFTDYQGQRQTIGRTVIATVPTLLQRQGIFTEQVSGRAPVIYDPATTVVNGGTVTRTQFANATIPLDRFDSVARGLLNRFPLPTSTGTANNYRRVGNETVDQDQFDARIDHRFGNGQDQAFGRMSFFREEFLPVAQLPDGSGTAAGAPGPQKTRSSALALNYQRVFSGRMLNEVRFGDTRRHVDRDAVQLGGTPLSELGLPGIPGNTQFANTLPTFTPTGYQLGSAGSTATDFGTSVSEFADTLSWLLSSHTLKIGADLRWERLNVVQPAFPTGSFAFTTDFTNLPGTANTGNALASFLLGQVSSFQIDLQQQQIRNRAHWQEYFIQDDWRVNDRVTVNAGVRYTLNFPSHEADDQAAVFNLETQQLEFLGVDGNPQSARRLHKSNFGPRLGVATRITDKTVWRAGYGLVFIEQAGITTPFTHPSFPFVQTVTLRNLDNAAPAFVLANGPTVQSVGLTADAGLGQGVFSVSRDQGSGYVQQWNTALQRELTPDMSVEVAYAGSKITNVGIPDSNLNQLTVEQLATGPALLERVPNPYFGIIPRSSSLGDPTITRAQLLKAYPDYTTVSLYRNNVGTTEYHAFQLKVEQRVAQGLSYLVSYTRSKLLDTASSVFDASIPTGLPASFAIADSHNLALERDYSNGDIPHVFVTSVVAELPAGRGRHFEPTGIVGAIISDWSLNGVVTVQSGMPVTVTQTNQNAFAGFGTQRPNIVGDPELPDDQRSTAMWFNTAAFAAAPQFTLGTASRNPVRGPGYRNLDLALVRRIRLQGSHALEVRGEVFNATNTPPFGQPNGTLGNAAFGSITTAGDPRTVQFALKWLF